MAIKLRKAPVFHVEKKIKYLQDLEGLYLALRKTSDSDQCMLPDL